MSESSEDEFGEFDGFSQNEIAAAENYYNYRLQNEGIGDSDEENNDSDENDPPINNEADNVDEMGDAPPQDPNAWHSDFRYYDRGLPNLFSPRGHTGPTRILGVDRDPVDFLSLFLSHEILEFIITETNRYAVKQIREHPDENKQPWVIPTEEEMKAFLGLCFLMGINIKPDLKSYWSSDITMETPYFGKTIPRDRFMQIMRYLHFSNCDREPQPGEPNYSVLYKVKELMTLINSKMVELFIPKRQVSVDEMMVPWKGRLAFKQYMPAKPTKWGIKMWALAEADTGYVAHCEIYSGRTEGQAGPGLATRVVKSCLEKASLMNRGYHVYMDNYFSSPALFSDLIQNHSTSACGTVRLNRRDLPKDIMSKNPSVVLRNRGESQFRQKGEITAVVWKDKKNVNVISTIHNDTAVTVQRNIQQDNGQFRRQDIACPKMVADYIKYMGGVDKADQYTQYYVFKHKTLKWPKRIFFTMLEIIKFNAYRLYLLSPNHQPAPGKKPLTFLEFSKSVASGLIAGYVGGSARRGRPSLAPVDDRLTQRHMPGSFPNRSWCHVCYMRVRHALQDSKKMTKFGCLDCGKHLCLPECFTRYHTVKNYC